MPDELEAESGHLVTVTSSFLLLVAMHLVKVPSVSPECPNLTVSGLATGSGPTQAA